MSAPLGIGIRSGSYGSLDKQVHQNGTARKASKMLKEKEKERLFLWICKFAGRKKVGMLFLCLISAAVFIWVLYVGKAEDSQDGNTVSSINVNESVSASDSTSENSTTNAMGLTKRSVLPPPPAGYFLGYRLPPGHPCNSFTLPPPPADKKRTGPRPCPVCYLPVEEAIGLMPALPSPSPVLGNLTYVYEENLSRDGEFGGSDFGGYPTLKQRNDSFDIRESMSVHCGFVRGIKPGRNTGFDIDEADHFEMEQCNGVVVASAIFGNFDEINEPNNISDYSRKTVCFLMFVDEETEKYLISSGKLGISKKIGLWRIIVARNLPYPDARRTGKKSNIVWLRFHLSVIYHVKVNIAVLICPQYTERGHENAIFQSFCCIDWFRMLAILYGLMGSLSLLWIHIKFLKGFCGERMLLLQYQNIIDALMYSLRLRQIKLLESMKMPLLTFR
ncbi:hypothetical protein GLYMA_13G179300v4 [Glycine max]|nr:hypothetical protein GLYMA_13G179300v4 [Glycine max]KAH1102097.1 hypothetical protein GYH30_036585 [Glycine max]